MLKAPAPRTELPGKAESEAFCPTELTRPVSVSDGSTAKSHRFPPVRLKLYADLWRIIVFKDELKWILDVKPQTGKFQNTRLDSRRYTSYCTTEHRSR